MNQVQFHRLADRFPTLERWLYGILYFCFSYLKDTKMQISYWESRWQKNNIGFHNPEINSYLLEFAPISIPENTKKVLVPLCGKTKDMIWLRDKGYSVIGIEAIPLACESFFREQEIPYELKKSHGFTIYFSENLEIWCGDFFKFPNKVIQECEFIYDRACIVALPSELRILYAKKINEAAVSGTNMLVHTFFYDQEKMAGPPFSVPNEEIDQKFSEQWQIKTLFDNSVLAKYERYRTKGLNQLSESVLHLVKK
jgi:thiopurine S-methyltransferase